MTKERINKLVEALVAMREMATDGQALAISILYPSWDVNMEYKIDARVRHGEKLYRCLKEHKSQPDRTPDVEPELWIAVGDEKK